MERADFADDGSLHAVLLAALQDAVRQAHAGRPDWAIASNLDYPLSLGEQRYPLPDDAVDVLCIRHTDGDGERIERRAMTDLERYGSPGNGRPAYFTVSGQGPSPVLEVWPIPDDDYTVRLFYYSSGAEITSAGAKTDEADLPQEYHRLMAAALTLAADEYRREPTALQGDAARQWQYHLALISRAGRGSVQYAPQYASLPDPPASVHPFPLSDLLDENVPGWRGAQ